MKKLILALVLAPSLAFADGFFGGGAGGGGSGTVSSGTTNTLSKYTAATTVGNSAITDDGSGAIGIYPASGTPQAVTETFASGSGTDIAGANTTIKLSGSTGSGLGGTLAIQNTNKAGAGSTANTYGNVLTLSPPNTGTTAPVNYVNITNAITSGNPTIASTGSDSAINLFLDTKSTGYIAFSTGGTPRVLVLGNSLRPNTNATVSLGAGGAGYSSLLLSAGGYIQWDQEPQISRPFTRGVQIGANESAPADYTLKGPNTTTNGNVGGNLIVAAGNGATTGAGGVLYLHGGTSPSGQPGTVVLGSGYAITNLPTGQPEGSRAWVTDQVTACPAIGVAPTAGGAIRCPVFFNGTAWVGG